MSSPLKPFTMLNDPNTAYDRALLNSSSSSNRPISAAHAPPSPLLNSSSSSNRPISAAHAPPSPLPSPRTSPDLHHARVSFMSGTKGGSGSGSSRIPRQAIPHDRAIYITRLCLRILSLLLSIAVIAVLAHVMAAYARTKGLQATNPATGLTYPVWPVDTNLTPSNLLLGAACVCAAARGALVVASGSKNVRRLTDIGNISTLAVSITATLLWIAATVYFKLWDTKRTAYDLWSWVCMHEDRNRFGFEELDMAPLCHEMRFAYYGAVAIAAVEVLAVGTCVWAIVRGRRYQPLGGEQMEGLRRG